MPRGNKYIDIFQIRHIQLPYSVLYIKHTVVYYLVSVYNVITFIQFLRSSI